MLVFFVSVLKSYIEMSVLCHTAKQAVKSNLLGHYEVHQQEDPALCNGVDTIWK